MNNGNLKLTLCALAILLGGALFGAIVMWLSPFVTSFFPMIRYIRVFPIIFEVVYGLAAFFLLVMLCGKTKRPSTLGRPSTIFQRIVLVMMLCGGAIAYGGWIMNSDMCKSYFSGNNAECIYVVDYGYHSFRCVDRWYNPVFGQSIVIIGQGVDKWGETMYVGYSYASPSNFDESYDDFEVQVYGSDFKLVSFYSVPGLVCRRNDDPTGREVREVIADRLREEGIYL